MPTGAVIRTGCHGQRAREGEQLAVVVVAVGEGDEGLVPAAVVPGETALKQTTIQAPGEDGVGLGRLLPSCLAGCGGGGHLLGVTDHDHAAAAPHGTHGIGHPDLGGLIKDDNVHVAAVGREEPGHRVGRDEQAGSQGGDEVTVGADQLAHTHGAATAVELAAQCLGAGGGALKDLVAVGQDDVEQFGGEGCPQLLEDAAVALDEPVVGGGVEGVQAGGAGPLLQGGLGGRRIGGVLRLSGASKAGEVLSSLAVGRASRCRLVQASAVGVELGADPGQLGAQHSRVSALSHFTGADLGPGAVSGLSSPQGQGAAQCPTNLGRLHSVVVQVEQQVPDAGLLAQAPSDDVEG